MTVTPHSTQATCKPISAIVPSDTTQLHKTPNIQYRTPPSHVLPASAIQLLSNSTTPRTPVVFKRENPKFSTSTNPAIMEQFMFAKQRSNAEPRTVTPPSPSMLSGLSVNSSSGSKLKGIKCRQIKVDYMVHLIAFQFVQGK